MESVFLEIEGRRFHFLLQSWNIQGDILKLSFEGYDSNEKISEFNGCRIIFNIRYI